MLLSFFGFRSDLLSPMMVKMDFPDAFKFANKSFECEPINTITDIESVKIFDFY